MQSGNLHFILAEECPIFFCIFFSEVVKFISPDSTNMIKIAKINNTG